MMKTVINYRNNWIWKEENDKPKIWEYVQTSGIIVDQF